MIQLFFLSAIPFYSFLSFHLQRQKLKEEKEKEEKEWLGKLPMALRALEKAANADKSNSQSLGRLEPPTELQAKREAFLSKALKEWPTALPSRHAACSAETKVCPVPT